MSSSRGLTFSAVLHIIIVLLVAFGLPYFQPKIEEQASVITVELLPISDKVNAPNMTKSKPKKLPEKEEPKKQEPKPKKVKEKEPEKPKEQEKPKEPEKPKEIVPVKEPVKKEPEKEKPKEKVKEKTPEKPAEKKPEKPKKPEKEKPKEDDASDFDKLMKGLSDDKPKPSKETDKPAAPDAIQGDKNIKSNTPFNPNENLSMTEMDAIKSQIIPCWNAPLGAKDIGSLVVNIGVAYRQDGTADKVFLASGQQSRYSSDSAFRAAADSAMRAVRNCSLKNMQANSYQSWKEVIIQFDPTNL